MILFGGIGGYSETWQFTFGSTPALTQMNTVHAPSPRWAAPGVYDPIRDRMIIFGGETSTGNSSEVWALTLSGTPDWQQLAPSGVGPPARGWGIAAYDANRNRMLIFGGRSGSYTMFNDVWALNLSDPISWTQLNPQGPAPSQRWGHVGIYDPALDRLVIHSGATDVSYTVNNETWALTLAGTPMWTQLSPPTPLPRARALATAVYDPVDSRMLVYGGYPNGAGEVWAFALTGQPAWSQLAPAGISPAPRWSHAAIYRSATQDMTILGGFGGNYLSDAAALAFTRNGLPVITSFTPHGGRINDPVTILGVNLYIATSVQFNGVSAPIILNQYGMIKALVPNGATTGPITVTTSQGSVTSADEFFVGGTPIINEAVPGLGRVGDEVAIHGGNFVGATHVSFGGAGSAAFVINSDDLIVAVVDTLARTGPISVTTPAATGTSPFDFQVIPPEPRPRLVLVRDVPGDQGGRVTLAWEASDFDKPNYRVITGYRVWRRAYVRTGAAQIADRPDKYLATRAVRPDGTLTTEFWESLTELPSAFLKGYAYVAGTLQDSTAAGNPYAAFFVQALTADRFIFYNSNVDSGYSVDNLSPPQPRPFSAVYMQTEVSLHWTKSTAPDFREFRLHRGSGTSFAPGPDNLLAVVSDTLYVDRPPQPTSAYYKLAAVDLHGNVSRFSLVAPDAPTAALASLVTVETQADHIRLTWFSAGNPGTVATVYRRAGGEDWAPLGAIAADGAGYLRYEDRAVSAGARYGYRLGIFDGDAEVFAGEVWATAAGRLDFTLDAVRPNPTQGGPLTVRFVLPSAARARLELLDIGGRRVAEREVGSLGPGRHAVDLEPPTRLAPGVYFLRLRQGGELRTTRVAVLN
jgi:hypothetical protein